MTFHIITIFPKIFDSYFNESILKKAQKKRLIEIKVHNLREFANDDKRKTVDDRPFGGGPGMVLKIEPIYKAVKLVKSKIKRKKLEVILFSAKGKKFDQGLAHKFSKLENLIFICGRYEGVDERVVENIIDEEISIGDYILSGGELAAMVAIETITRLIPGTLGNIDSLEERRLVVNRKISREKKIIYSYPTYTRPAIFEPKSGIKWRVPKVLLSGNHEEIKVWRRRHTSLSKES